MIQSSASIPKPDEDNSNKAVDILKDIRLEVKAMKAVTKPKSWGRGSVSSYYRLKFALEMKMVVDEMVATGKERVYRYDKFTKQPYKFSANTLYSYVYQSLRFLKTETIEGVDKVYYTPILDRIVTNREPGVGVRLSFHTNVLASDVDMSPDEVAAKSGNAKLINKIRDWIEEAQAGDKLEIDKLALNESEIAEISETLSGTESFLEKEITSKQITLLKIA